MNITPEAADAIQTLLSERTGGLRIFVAVPQGDNSHLEMGLALRSDPDPGDEILLTEQGSPVFVEARLSPVLANKTLDVATNEGDEAVAFRLVS